MRIGNTLSASNWENYSHLHINIDLYEAPCCPGGARSRRRNPTPIFNFLCAAVQSVVRLTNARNVQLHLSYNGMGNSEAEVEITGAFNTTVHLSFQVHLPTSVDFTGQISKRCLTTTTTTASFGLSVSVRESYSDFEKAWSNISHRSASNCMSVDCP